MLAFNIQQMTALKNDDAQQVTAKWHSTNDSVQKIHRSDDGIHQLTAFRK
jgi:hypothetical protein